MTDDFFKGYSQGMTGSTGGNPSQSVLEAMGRDAARNQWNGNNNNGPQTSGGGGYGVARDGVPITTVLYEAGQKMQGKKLARDFGIASALVIVSTLLNPILPSFFEWILVIPYFAGIILGFWTFLRLPVFLIAKAGSLISKPKKTDT